MYIDCIFVGARAALRRRQLGVQGAGREGAGAREAAAGAGRGAREPMGKRWKEQKSRRNHEKSE